MDQGHEGVLAGETMTTPDQALTMECQHLRMDYRSSWCCGQCGTKFIPETDIAALRAQLAQVTAERDRWSEDSHQLALAIKRLAAAAEDRNVVDKHRQEFHEQQLAEASARVTELEQQLARDLSDWADRA